MYFKRSTATLLLLLLTLFSAAWASTPPAAAIASAHPLATAAGHEILDQGGNAFDAAIAVTAALAVAEPYSSGIGGGGFYLLHRAKDDFQVMIDARERAPLAARHDMYLDDMGQVMKKASLNGALAAAIPGIPAGLEHLAQNYGKLPLKTSLAPAIRIAKQGVPITQRYRDYAKLRQTPLLNDLEASGIFLDEQSVPGENFILKQPDLANTLQAIADQGRDGFYKGSIARLLVDGVSAAGGIWSMKDLAEYRIEERRPLRAKYKGMTITSAPPPSSGGVALIEALNILSAYDLAKLNKVTRTHLIIEAMRRAYRDRAEYLGDPDFVDIPVVRLTSLAHAKRVSENVNLTQATPSNKLPAVKTAKPGGYHTTHFSILDKQGNRVAATLSINYPFGACFVPPDTGVLLNDEMDDFSAKPGTPNAYGLIGNHRNAIAPGKRPISSMSPTFIENERGIAILGTPGGSRIISMVLLGILDYAEGGSAQSMVNLPRFHHQYLPDQVLYEDKAFSPAEIQGLQALGHKTKRRASPYGGGRSEYGNMQVVVWDKKANKIEGAADARGFGKADVRLGLN